MRNNYMKIRIGTETIRRTFDLVEHVRGYVELTPAGLKRYRGLCPFHSEQTPSFTIFEETGRFYCFGCGATGDVIDFYRLIHRVSFRDACHQLSGGHAGRIRWTRPDPMIAWRRALVYNFREWEANYSEILCQWLAAANRLLFRQCLGPDDLPKFADIIRPKGVCENHLDVLALETDQQKYFLFQAIKAGQSDC